MVAIGNAHPAVSQLARHYFKIPIIDPLAVASLLDAKASWGLEALDSSFSTWKAGGTWTSVVCNPQNRAVYL